MTITEALAKIVGENGEGYQNYTPQALIYLWKAVGDIVNSPMFEPRRAYGMFLSLVDSTTDLNIIPATDINLPSLFPAITDYIFFKREVLMRPLLRDTLPSLQIYYSSMYLKEYDKAKFRARGLSTVPRMIYYCEEYPYLHWMGANFTIPDELEPAVEGVPATRDEILVTVEVRGYGISEANSISGSTELNSYMDTKMQADVITLAAAYLSKEIIS